MALSAVTLPGIKKHHPYHPMCNTAMVQVHLQETMAKAQLRHRVHEAGGNGKGATQNTVQEAGGESKGASRKHSTIGQVGRLTLMRRITAVALPFEAVPKMVPMGLPSQSPCGE